MNGDDFLAGCVPVWEPPSPEEIAAHVQRESCNDDGGECEVCSVRDCPYGSPLHYHHDGCPAC